MKIYLNFSLMIIVFCSMMTTNVSIAQEDQRLQSTATNDDFYNFPQYKTKSEWLNRKDELKNYLMASFGLLPLEERNPINVTQTGITEEEDYIVENIYFESLPGFFVTGNLYRPKGEGPFPAILSAHGHWEHGRLEDTERGSIPGRAINFARQGYVVFSFDMIGYVDSIQLSHNFYDKQKMLWGLSLHGLQFWNSLRALDYLASHPQVDSNRIAMTGASGGGTQTIFLMALDDRIKAAAPVNMISSHFQGGCECENAPLLRIKGFNTEFAAMMAPRPLLMVSATGDWTNETPWVEYPAVKSIYDLFDAQEKVKSVQIDAPHNYNEHSREAVYQWFAKWILDNTDQYKETSFTLQPSEELKVFPENQLPDQSINSPDRLATSQIVRKKQKINSYLPDTITKLEIVKSQLKPALQATLLAELPQPNDLKITRPEIENHDDSYTELLLISRKGIGENIKATFHFPKTDQDSINAVIIYQDPNDPSEDQDTLIQNLLEKGYAVLIPEFFKAEDDQRNKEFEHFYTYNKSITALRIQDILTTHSFLKTRNIIDSIHWIGQEKAGLWTILAAPFADDVESLIADVNGFDTSDDQLFVEEFFIPNIRRVGDFNVALALGPEKLALHNTQDEFDTSWASAAYITRRNGHNYLVESQQMNHEQILNLFE